MTPSPSPVNVTPFKQWGLGRGWYITLRRAGGLTFGATIGIYTVGDNRSLEILVRVGRWKVELGWIRNTKPIGPFVQVVP